MIVRVNKTENYTVMANYHLKDHNLSYRTKGLLSVVLSLPDNWNFTIAGLASLSSDGKTAVKTMLNELKENGYLAVTKKMPNETATGRIEYEYDFYETPQTEKQEGKKQGIETLPLESLSVESQGLSNTNISNTNNINSIPPISPLENRKLLFKQFWEAYPKCERKVNYEGCEKKFIKIENLEQIFPDIMASLEVWKKRWSKDNNKFVPTTHKWINQKYWTVTDMRTETQIKIDEVVKENSNDFLL